MTPRQLRLVRAAAASSSATVLAAVSHTVGGGMPPHPLLIVAVAVLLIAPAAVLIGRRPSFARTTTTVVLSQLVFHLLFHFLGGTWSSASVVSGHSHMHDVVLGPVVAAALPDAPMLLAHMIAAVLTVAALHKGERMLRGIAAWVQARLLPALPAVPARHRAPALPVPLVLAVALAPLRTTVARRGPPLI